MEINKLSNANVYFNGGNFAGKAEEVTLPEPKQKLSEVGPLGMHGTLELSSGIEKMTAKIKWNSLYPDVLKAAKPFDPQTFIIRGSLETHGPNGRTQEQPVVATLKALVVNAAVGALKSKDAAMPEMELSVSYYELTIGGEPILRIDIFNNIHEVAGVDQLATWRANLGV